MRKLLLVDRERGLSVLSKTRQKCWVFQLETDQMPALQRHSERDQDGRNKKMAALLLVPHGARGDRMTKRYVYGMRLRGFSPGAQPKDGFLDREDDPLGDYWDILIYSRRLTDQETKDYDFDYLGTRKGE